MTDPVIVYTSESIAHGISAISVWALLFAILRNPKVRSNTFNLYLVLCLAPGAITFPSRCLFKSLFLVEQYQYLATGDILLYVDWWIADYWLCASLWMSFSVFVQIYKLLKANKRAKRYQPPTRKQVIKDSMIIYIFSGVIATLYPLLSWRLVDESWSDRDDRILFWATTYIPALYIPTLLITGMCFGVWWSKLIPRKNARHCALTLFFVRLIASTYLVAIGSTIALSAQYWPNENEETTFDITFYSFIIFYLFGFFQVCLALTKKDIRDAFVEMWCCYRKHDDGGTSSAAAGRTVRSTKEESDSCELDHPTVNDATTSVKTSSVLDEDIRPNENDDKEAHTSFVDSTEQNEGIVIADIDYR